MGHYNDKKIKFILSTYTGEPDIKYTCIEVSVGGELIPGISCDTLQEATKQFDQWIKNTRGIK